jgi:hypothetical protein
MRTLKNLCLLIIVISISIKINAQKLELTALKRIDPYIIIASNYISMPDCSISNNKSFDINNPYTYLQLMVDENGGKYQMLYQTDFTDALVYMSISNNANHQCFQVKKNEYCSCVNKSHEEIFPSMQISSTLDCAIRILRRCEE